MKIKITQVMDDCGKIIGVEFKIDDEEFYKLNNGYVESLVGVISNEYIQI